jgi:hypothetical protein
MTFAARVLVAGMVAWSLAASVAVACDGRKVLPASDLAAADEALWEEVEQIELCHAFRLGEEDGAGIEPVCVEPEPAAGPGCWVIERVNGDDPGLGEFEFAAGESWVAEKIAAFDPGFGEFEQVGEQVEEAVAAAIEMIEAAVVEDAVAEPDPEPVVEEKAAEAEPVVEPVVEDAIVEGELEAEPAVEVARVETKPDGEPLIEEEAVEAVRAADADPEPVIEVEVIEPAIVEVEIIEAEPIEAGVEAGAADKVAKGAEAKPVGPAVKTETTNEPHDAEPTANLTKVPPTLIAAEPDTVDAGTAGAADDVEAAGATSQMTATDDPEMAAEIAALRKVLADRERENDALKRRVDRLEAAVDALLAAQVLDR